MAEAGSATLGLQRNKDAENKTSPFVEAYIMPLKPKAIKTGEERKFVRSNWQEGKGS